ncbi:flavin reductase [Nonlabens tegetincola]|uniref:flavin reductase family protein n=1 Tax=Nonlabens tegetincola TaxID=323273 RepID=UPI0030C82FEF
MKHISSEDIAEMDRFYRGNLITGLTGFKPAHLIGTRSKEGIDNLAIFSNVTHLGSNPALFCFILRPLGYGAGHTYENLKATGYLTLNHVNPSLIKKAHSTSAKFPVDISEFKELDIEKIERTGFKAPFVANSNIQVAASYVNDILIDENQCRLVICKITDVFLKEDYILEDGFLNLEEAESTIINGLDAYGKASLTHRYSYAQIETDVKPITYNKNETKSS